MFKLSFESKLLLMTLLASVPSSVALVILMLYSGISVYLTAMVGIILVLVIAWCAAYTTGKTNYLFRTLSNLLEAMTKGDYSLRGRKEYSDSALDNLVAQINLLSETLAKQQLEVEQKQLLLGKVIKHIDVAIIARDENDQITLTNPAAKRLLENNPVSDIQTLKQSGKYNIVKDQFIQDGKLHHLWFITDVRDLLRAQERKAWQNLIRVLSHEINNSLTPISSISQTLRTIAHRSANLDEDKEDILEGMQLITERAKSLKSFIDSYRQLSRLPQPKRQDTLLKPLIQKVVLLFDGATIEVDCDEALTSSIDPIQFEQLLINLIKNGIEASSDQTKPIEITCKAIGSQHQISIKDQGPGIKNPDNLFVPFYTTKPGGSGTGLVLSRQIIEAHGGDLVLRNRQDMESDKRGCEVIVTVNPESS